MSCRMGIATTIFNMIRQFYPILARESCIATPVVSEKLIVLSGAVLKWSVQSNRYGDVSISGCRSIPRSIVHQQSRLEGGEFRCKPSMGHHISRSKVGVILRRNAPNSIRIHFAFLVPNRPDLPEAE